MLISSVLSPPNVQGTSYNPRDAAQRQTTRAAPASSRVAAQPAMRADDKLLADIANVLQEVSGRSAAASAHPLYASSAQVAAVARPMPSEADASLLEEKLSLQKAREALILERDAMASAHKRRMAELDGIRKLLEGRATEVEHAHKGLEKERRRLASEFEAKVSEVSEGGGSHGERGERLEGEGML